MGAGKRGTAGLQKNVLALAVGQQEPVTVYAGTDDGLYKTVNGGETWTPMNEGLPGLAVEALAVDPQEPQTLYAGTAGVGGVVQERRRGRDVGGGERGAAGQGSASAGGGPGAAPHGLCGD